jgi:hypothetical protein
MDAPELIIPVRFEPGKSIAGLQSLERAGTSAGQAVAKGMDEAQHATGRAAKAADGMRDSLISFAGAQQALGAAGNIAREMVQHFDKIRQDAAQAAKDVQSMRESFRELAALRNEMSTRGATLAHLMQVSTRTLQRPQEVKEMEEAGLGIGELALGPQGTMSREEFTKALEAAGKMQTMEGGPAGAYGAMVGQIALSSKEKLDAAGMQGRLNRMFQIQQPGGFRNFGQAAAQYGRIQPLIQAGVLTPEQGMGLLSAFSTASPEEAATMVDQFVRSTMGGRLKERGMKVPEGMEFETQAAYMQELGADKLTDPLKIGEKIAEDLRKQEEATKRKGEQWDPYRYLQSHGFAQQQERDMVMLFSGLKNKGTLAKIEQAMGAKPQKGAIDRLFAERMASEPMLQGRAAELSEHAATVQQGLAEEPLVIAQRAAFARLKAQGKISGSFDEWRNTGLFQRGWQDLWQGGYHRQMDVEASRGLRAERERLGLPQLGQWQWSEHDAMARSAREVQAAGGDLTRGVAQDLASAAKAIHEAAVEMREARKVPVAMPPPRPSGRM